MQGSFLARHEARKTFRQHGVFTPGDEDGGAADGDGTMLRARHKRVRAQAIALQPGPGPVPLSGLAGDIVNGFKGVLKRASRAVQRQARQDLPSGRTAPVWSDGIREFTTYIDGVVRAGGATDHELLGAAGVYVSIGGMTWSGRMLLDAIRLRGMCCASSKQLNDLVYLLWTPDTDEGYIEWLKDSDHVAYLEGQQSIANFYYPGSLARIKLQITRSLLFSRAGSGGEDPRDEEQSDFLSLEFSSWAATLWKNIHEHRKREWHLNNRSEMKDEDVEDVQLVFASFEDFRARLQACVYPDQEVMTFIADCVFMQDSLHTGPIRAQQLDSYYARLVKGAMVSAHISVVWSPSDETEHSDRDNQVFSDVMWKTLIKVMDTESIRRGATDADMLRRTVHRIKHIKSAMKDIWEQSILSRVTNEVHMVESMVLARLHADGVFPWLGAAGGRSTLRLCFVMRRHDAFKYSFAAAVGKRMASERLLSSNRASIIEHHRSASWAEREYMSLYRHMSANAGAFSQALQGAEDGELLQDYTDMERKDLEMQRVRDARRYVEQATGQRQP